MSEYRISVEPDIDIENPLTWSGDDYAVISLESSYYNRPDIEGNLADTVTKTALEKALYYAENDDDFFSAVIKHFQRRGYLVTEREWRGYSQGDYKRYILAIDVRDETGPGYIDGMAKTYEQWLSGDVYGVILQRLTKWTSEHGDVMETWEDVPDCAIWGNYLDDDYTALDVAREHFGVELPTDVDIVNDWY